MKWYKHDSDANMDGKLQEVLLDYGLEGYGLYWYCLELITAKVDADNVTFKIDHDSRIIARNTGSTPQKVQEMMNRFVELGLFENSDGFITCLKLARRIDKSMTSNPAMREIIGNLNNSHDSIMTQSCKPMQDKIRFRLDKTKENKPVRRFTPPNVDEVKTYCDEKNYGIDPSAFIDYYTVNNWMRGKSKIKDWKACVRTWEARNPKQEIKKTNSYRPMPKPGE